MAEFSEVLIKSAPEIIIETRGDPNSKEFRVQALTASTEEHFSLWHDVPLFPSPTAREARIVNMINEIPRCSRKKYEIATNERHNPIKQDIKKGKLREFGKGDVYFNYGCIPQTWEDPDHEHPDAKARGDNDPLDICEIGLRILGVGEIVPVKILGTLCLIDEGEADWKLIGIHMSDPWAPLLNDVCDLEDKLPGTIEAIREWFRTYKVPDGKPENKFGLEERCMPSDYAMSVIAETHESWKALVSGLKDFIPSDGTVSGLKRNLSYPKLDLDSTEMSPGGLKRDLSYPRIDLSSLA